MKCVRQIPWLRRMFRPRCCRCDQRLYKYAWWGVAEDCEGIPYDALRCPDEEACRDRADAWRSRKEAASTSMTNAEVTERARVESAK